jgi:hypothetical protein
MIAALKISHLEQLNNKIFALPIWVHVPQQ